MNKKYAMEIIECIERGTLERDCSLAREAMYYLERLVLKHKEMSYNDYVIMERIYRINNKR